MYKSQKLYITLALIMVCFQFRIVFAADLQVGGSLVSKQYGTSQNIITQNPCIIKSGIHTVFATDRKTFINNGFTLKYGGTLKVTVYDNDGLQNEWEFNNFGHYNYGSQHDPDNDGLTNIMEFQIGTNPNVSNIAAGATFADTDKDNLPDAWELNNHASLSENANTDSDGDGLTNSMEFQIGTDPKKSDIAVGLTFPDTDSDGLSDVWELNHHKNLSENADTDSDGDGLTNIMEYQIGSNPQKSNIVAGATFPDTDKDGMSDVWELIHFGGLNQIASNDYDGDGLINIIEFLRDNDSLYVNGNLKDKSEHIYIAGNIITQNTTTVNSPKHTIIDKKYNVFLNSGFSIKTGAKFTIKLQDNDGLLNAWELYYFGSLAQNSTSDFDGDGVSNIDEFTLNLNPNEKDTDHDGINDYVEIVLNTSPTDPDNKPSLGNYYEYDELGRIKRIIRVQ